MPVQDSLPTVPNKCGTCSKVFKTKFSLKLHQDIHNPSRRPKYACKPCKKTFFRVESLHCHLKIVHQKAKRKYICVFCENKFFNKHQLSRHIISHIGEKPFWCGKCDKEFASLKVVKVHQKQHNIEKPFICKLCPSSFKSRSGLQFHKVRHRAKLFECVMCVKYFPSEQELRRHIVSHLKEKPFFCSICPEEFNQKGVLTRHMERIHNIKQKVIIRPRCVFCLKPFHTDSDLEKHIKTHLKERPVNCSNCDDEFRDDYELKRHLERKKCKKINGTYSKTPTGEWKFRCGVCFKFLSSKYNLIRHMELHESSRIRRFACAICEQAFFTIQHLLGHIEIIHRGVKKEECIFCERGFGERSTLYRHILMHIGEKRFCCHLCDAELSDPRSIQNHKKQHS